MRITGGVYRSRAISAPRGHATRPTSDRVREALFGILASAGALEGARVLDLYAGSGALALEALSRGASHATLVESSREALAAIRANVEVLGVEDRVRVVASDVRAAARRLARTRNEPPFDLVFADPPWALVDSGVAGRAVAGLVRRTIAPSGTVVLEHASRTDPPELEGLALVETRPYGDTALSFYKPAILAPACAPNAGSTSE